MARKIIHFPTLPPREYQLDFWRAIDSGVRKVILSYPRRGGKDITSCMYMARQALVKPGTYWILAPTRAWASRIYWSGVSEVKYRCPITGRVKSRQGSILDIAIPPEIRAKTNTADQKIYLPNGSIVALGGTEEESFVGQTGEGFILTEYSLHKEGILPLINPILSESGGWLIINGTQRDTNNQLYKLIEATKDNPQWYTSWQYPEDIKSYYWKSPIDPDTGKREIEINLELEGKRDPLTGIPYENIQDLVDVEPHKKVLYMREYMNIPMSVEMGSYYSDLLNIAEQKDNIGNFKHNPSLPVYTAWDIGIRDSTSIVFFQMDVDTKTPIIIDYYEETGKGVAHYIDKLRAKPYRYGQHFVPVDASKRSFQMGIDLVELCRVTHGFRMTKLHKTVSLKSDIELCREIIPDTKFNLGSKEVKVLVEHLYGYSENPNTNKPEHDNHSHAADAFRYMVIAINAGMVRPILSEPAPMPSTVSDFSMEADRHSLFTPEGLPLFTE